MQSSDLSLSKILRADMLQGNVNFTDFRTVGQLDIDQTTLISSQCYNIST